MSKPERETDTSEATAGISDDWTQYPIPLGFVAPQGHDAVTDERRPPLPRRSSWLRWTSRVVILAGLAVLACAGIRYWQDEIVTAQHQNRLSAEFDRRVELVEAGLPLSDLAADPSDEITKPLETVSVADNGDDPRMILPSSAPTAAEIEALQQEQPVIPGIVREFAPNEGEVLGRIRIPKLDIEWMLIEGVDLTHLRSGPGHMPWTPVPGQPGNAVVSGHRTTHGAPFFDLDLLEEGDFILVYTLTGTHTYRVHETVIVLPSGVWVTGQWDGAWLTLTTCNPKYSAAERLIVFAELVDGPNAEAINTLIESVPPQAPENA